MPQTWIIIDVPNLMWRSFHTTGQLVNGTIFGFFKILFHTQQLLSVRQTAFCFDRKPLLRHQLQPDYKRRRPRTPEDEVQHGLVRREIRRLRRDVLPSLGYRNVFGQKGLEADDIIARLCGSIILDSSDSSPSRAIIVSSDEDLFQCLHPQIDLWSPSRKDLITEEKFKKEYGIEPIRWPGVKALAGCASDNVKGIPGVGEKTALKYLTGKLSPASKAAESIYLEEERTVARNWKLVKLPLPGVEVGPFELREGDGPTPKQWREFCRREGFTWMKNLMVDQGFLYR